MAGSGSNFEDLLQCMICFEPYRSPKMLRCGHTFCQECLAGYLRTYQVQRRALPGKLPCPTCRELTSLPPTGVAGLRNDFKVAKIEEMFKTMNIQRNKAKSSICDPCKANKKSSSAKVFCASCSMNYCSTCMKKHEKNPLFKGHNVKQKGAEDKSSMDLTCKKHKKEPGKYFCRTCELIVCTLCIMSEHDGHNVTEVNEMFMQHKDDIKNLQNMVNNKLLLLKKRMSDMESLRSLNLASCQRAELAIKDRTEALIATLRQQERSVLDQLKTMRDAKLKQISDEMESAGFLIAKGTSVQDFADMTTRKNSLRLMALHEDLVQRMRTVAEIDVSDVEPDVISLITFLPGHQDPSIGRIDLVQGPMEDLNKNLHPPVQRSASNRTTPAVASTSFNGDNPHSPMKRSFSEGGMDRSAPVAVLPGAAPSYPLSRNKRNRPHLLFNVNKVGSNVGEIKDPLGVACLLNGDIVVTEWGNKRIQVFDSVGKFVCALGNGLIGPQGVAITLRGNILITDANQKRLQVFTPSGQSIAKWGLGKFFGPCGVAVSANGNCVITDVAEHKVSIYRGEQKCLSRFGQKGPGDCEFNSPLYVTTGLHNEIIVSDSDNHCVKVFDSSGRFLRKIGSEGSGDGQLKYPRGVVVDNEGNLLVADRNNDRISQFNIHGRFLGHLLTKEDGIRDPYGLGVTITRNLVVTESAADRAALKMFMMD